MEEIKSKVTDENTKFSKLQLLKSELYRDNVDLLNVLLKNEFKYSIDEVDKLIKDFLKRRV